MTEEEAESQCGIGPENCGRTDAWTTVRYCIGSECRMAWRWIDPGYDIDYSSLRPPGEDWQAWRDDNGNLRWRRKRPNVQGYCGLAGKP